MGDPEQTCGCTWVGNCPFQPGPTFDHDGNEIDQIALVEWAGERSLVRCKADDPKWRSAHATDPANAPPPLPPEKFAEEITTQNIGRNLRSSLHEVPSNARPTRHSGSNNSRTLWILGAVGILVLLAAGAGIAIAAMDPAPPPPAAPKTVEKKKLRQLEGIETRRSIVREEPPPPEPDEL